MTVSVEAVDNILHVTWARPERKNALDVATIGMVVEALEQACTDDSLRAVLLTGLGSDFCSGADWVATNSRSDSRPRTGSIQRRTPLQAHRLIELIAEIQLPVVCVVRGWAAGLGFQIALIADFTVAAETARFWEPFMERGFSPDSGATWILPRLVGLARAKELVMLGRELSGRDAADWGLIYRAVPETVLDDIAQELLTSLAAAPTVALGLTKRCLHRGLVSGLVDAMESEAVALELSSRTADFKEGLAAFSERRSPRFQGR